MRRSGPAQAEETDLLALGDAQRPGWLDRPQSSYAPPHPSRRLPHRTPPPRRFPIHPTATPRYTLPPYPRTNAPAWGDQIFHACRKDTYCAIQ